MVTRRCPICGQPLPVLPGPAAKPDEAFAARHIDTCRRALAAVR